jgi:hypothetical protein
MLEYTLEISTLLEPTELLSFVFDPAPVQRDEAGWTVEQPGFRVSAFSITQPHPLALQVGVVSSLRLVLALNGMVNYGMVMGNVLVTVMEVLGRTQGNLIFYVDGVDVLLWRKGEKLCLNSSSNFWSPSFLASVNLPYELETLKPLVA